MSKKNALAAADLFVLLDREFRRRKPRDCPLCFVHLPYRVDVREPNVANWELVPAPECGRGCGLVLDELVAEFQVQYDLKPDYGAG